MTKLQVGLATLALCGSLFAGAVPSSADTPIKRVASLDSDHRGVSTPKKGATGRAVLQIHRAHKTLCYRIKFEGMTAFHADIRRMRNERIVKELYHGEPKDEPIRGCVEDVSRRALKRMVRHPRRFFVYLSEYNALGQPPSEIAGTIRNPSK